MEIGTFTPPAPGAWELEQTHVERPVTRWFGALFVPNLMRGFKHTTAKYGALLDYMEVAIVNGFVYMCPRPVGAPKKAKGAPPKLVFKLLTKLHPEIRRRIKRSAEVFENKLWREEVAHWDAVTKPQIIATNAKLAAVDPTKLDLAGLVQHLADAEARMADAIFHHHSLNLCAMVPPGDFVAHATEWTGKDASEMCALFRGTSPVSVGATAELERAVAAIRADAVAAKLLASDRTAGEILDQLRAHAGEAGAAVRAYVDVVGLRVAAGADIGDPYGLEQPEILVNALRTGPMQKHDAAAVAAETARIRAAVPEQHRAQFDELLAEARFVYRIRDERGYLNDGLATGIARRALLAAGDRLVAAGKLHARDHAVDLTAAEVSALLQDKPGSPTPDEVAARVTFRTTHTVNDAPAHLGFPPSAPPPAEWLPPGAARMMRAINIVLHAMFAVSTKKAEVKRLHGIAASAGTYEGRARVVLGGEQFANVQQGDVLIARTTCPSYNVLLPLLGGIVTDRGGLLSHAAIVAREYGLPAVVGTSDATKLVPDGARVRVDGVTGEVMVLS